MTMRTRAGQQTNAVQKANSASRIAAKAVADAKKLMEQNAKLAPAMTQEQVEVLIQTVVTRTLTGLGIHARNDDEIDEFRKDMEYMHAWRLSIQRAGRVGFVTTITIAIGGVLSMLWLGFKVLAGHGP